VGESELVGLLPAERAQDGPGSSHGPGRLLTPERVAVRVGVAYPFRGCVLPSYRTI
jgi:hypothetical protein